MFTFIYKKRSLMSLISKFVKPIHQKELFIYKANITTHALPPALCLL